MIDATHKFNQLGYRTFTAMGVRRNRRGKFRSSVIVGHLITSDLTAEPIKTWLNFLQQDFEAPAEVLIDVDVTEEKAIRSSFPSSTHIAFCYFHCMKAIMENFRAATPNQKGYAKALFRGLLLSRKPDTLLLLRVRHYLIRMCNRLFLTCIVPVKGDLTVRFRCRSLVPTMYGKVFTRLS